MFRFQRSVSAPRCRDLVFEGCTKVAVVGLTFLQLLLEVAMVGLTFLQLLLEVAVVSLTFLQLLLERQNIPSQCLDEI